MVPVCKLNYTSITSIIEERTDQLFHVCQKCIAFIDNYLLYFRIGIYMEMVLYIKKIFFNIVFRFVKYIVILFELIVNKLQIKSEIE
jgi:hypothetical protein